MEAPTSPDPRDPHGPPGGHSEEPNQPQPPADDDPRAADDEPWPTDDEPRPIDDELTPVADGFSERGRDLLLLGLALVIINEAVFTFYVIAQDSAALTAQMGRFALKAGMAYMTWQGYAVTRWVLAFLVGAAIVAGPFALLDAFRSGNLAFTAILAATFAAYAVSGWLLVFSRDVAAFIRFRRLARAREWLQ